MSYSPTRGPYRRVFLSGEFALIERLRRRFPPAPRGQTWIGDDAAAVPPPDGTLLLAADAVVEGVHVDLSLVGLDDVGWKAVAVNVSDIAAMGGRPLHLLLTVAAPAGTDLDLLAQGVADAAERWSCAVVGGDLTNGPALMLSVAVTGSVDGAPVLRSGARPGDVVYVTGPLGAGAAALRSLRAGGDGQAYRRPQARVAEGEAARRAGATAMIDVSDGLAADLGHIADASGVGVALVDVPVAPGATEADALGGGEDFELVFTLPDTAEAPPGSLPVGRCTADPGQRTLRGEPLPALGWEHGFS